MEKRSIMVGSLICLALFINACATFKKPPTINEAPILERALTKEDNGIRVSTSVLGDEEAWQIFGIDLAHKKIQAVWIEVENSIDRPIILLPTAIDPDYFAPLEVSFTYHKAFAADANAALDAHLLNLNFPIRNLIQPGSRASGYIFTNWTRGMKVVDVDLIGDDFSQNFTFFVPNPDSSIGRAGYYRPYGINVFDIRATKCAKRSRSSSSIGEVALLRLKREWRGFSRATQYCDHRCT